MNTTTSLPEPSGRQADLDLALQVVAGDSAAFARLMRQYNRRLFRLARVTLKHDGDA